MFHRVMPGTKEKTLSYVEFLLKLKESSRYKRFTYRQLAKLMVYRSYSVHNRAIDIDTVKYVMALFFNCMLDVMGVGFPEIRFGRVFDIQYHPEKRRQYITVNVLDEGSNHVKFIKTLVEEINAARDRQERAMESQRKAQSSPISYS